MEISIQWGAETASDYVIIKSTARKYYRDHLVYFL